MKKHEIITVFFSIAVAMIIGSVSPALASNDLVCDSIVNRGVYDNVTVPKGESCILNNVTVNGNIHAVGASSVVIVYSTIEGNIHIQKTVGLALIQKVDVGGNVVMVNNENSRFFTGISDSTIDGNVQFSHHPHSGLFIKDNQIGKNLNCSQNDPISGVNTNTVQGKINCKQIDPTD